MDAAIRALVRSAARLESAAVESTKASLERVARIFCTAAESNNIANITNEGEHLRTDSISRIECDGEAMAAKQIAKMMPTGMLMESLLVI